MTETENTPETTEDTGPVEYAKGSWQEALQKSSNLLNRSTKARKTASNLLWKGAKEGIENWLPTADDDVNGETLYGDVIEALGTGRKGDASKIKTVAVAVRAHGLDLSTFPNLSKAYTAASDLTKGVQARKEEDDAADKAVEAIEPPKTTSSVDGAALILLSKGVSGAVVAILDALGEKNEAAHRAFMREVSTEVAARIQANKPVKTPVAPKAKAGTTAAKKAAAPKATPVKGKPKGKPAGQTSSTPEPVEEPDTEPSADVDDIEADIMGDGEPDVAAVETPTVPVAKKGRAVVRRPGRQA